MKPAPSACSQAHLCACAYNLYHGVHEQSLEQVLWGSKLSVTHGEMTCWAPFRAHSSVCKNVLYMCSEGFSCWLACQGHRQQGAGTAAAWRP